MNKFDAIGINKKKIKIHISTHKHIHTHRICMYHILHSNVTTKPSLDLSQQQHTFTKQKKNEK